MPANGNGSDIGRRHINASIGNRMAASIFGCIGGGYEYCFTPTAIGMLAEIRCACGAKLDVDRI
ncbi:hypothetical protein CL3_12060 [butyrate-producing bacterium SM4/1]|nr:hypothetical protein CL3_12060 [butyrate-producing bacterium SM4/1]